MYAITKGTILITAIGKTSLYVFLCLLICMTVTIRSASSQEQNSTEVNKPKLVEITFETSNLDTNALQVAEKLNPEFFVYDTENFSEKPIFHARYIPLDPTNVNRFLVLTVTGTLYHCTNHGCPFYLYENKGDNKWGLVLSVQTHGIYYDLNRTANKPSNLISVGNMQANRKLRIWMWNGLRYEEVSKK